MADKQLDLDQLPSEFECCFCTFKVLKQLTQYFFHHNLIQCPIMYLPKLSKWKMLMIVCYVHIQYCSK